MPIIAEIVKEFRFEAAHFLPQVELEHRCHQMHGHSYKVKIKVKGPIDEKMGWVMDLRDIKDKFLNIKNTLDHKVLNNIDGLENPTTENLCIWILKLLKRDLPLLHSVTIRCSPTEVVTVKNS